MNQTTTLPKATGPKPKTSAAVPANRRLAENKTIPHGIIRIRAYQKWEAAGKPEGQSQRFWLEAERELSN